ncbi:MAG: cell division protein FtsX [Clostridium sp.]
MFSLASIATISACIFLFCLFFSLAANVIHGARTAQETVGISVFFDEGMTEDEILAAGEEIKGWKEVRQAEYTSAEEAWDTFKAQYFEGAEIWPKGLKTIILWQILLPLRFFKRYFRSGVGCRRLEAMDGVRRVRYSSTLAAGFTSVGKMIGLISALIIGVLLAVAVFLISNTISVAAAFRRRENEIMRYIGATNFMIRAPFLVEGLLLGFLGALVPLGGIWVLYEKGMLYLEENYSMITGLVEPLALGTIFPYMTGGALMLGVGIGLLVSFVTIQRHLRV